MFKIENGIGKLSEDRSGRRRRGGHTDNNLDAPGVYVV